MHDGSPGQTPGQGPRHRRGQVRGAVGVYVRNAAIRGHANEACVAAEVPGDAPDLAIRSARTELW